MKKRRKRLAALRAVGIALFLLLAFSLGRSDVYERLSPTPSPVPVAATAVPRPAAPLPEGAGTSVWITRSGSRYHATASCSSMTAPIGTTLGDAEKAGYTPCATCWAKE